MREFDELVGIMARLRAPEGCPWDREQTHESLKPFLLEECYEALEAVDGGDPRKLCSELGDVLLQIVFHAQVASEQGQFTIQDVCAGINDKLIRRHPHVFADVEVAGSDEVIRNWEQLKGEEWEAADRTSALDGVPRSLPALQRAGQLQKKAARVGFDWTCVRGPLEKVREELTELEQARAGEGAEALAHELGDLLFAVVNVARHLGVDAEDALRMACERFGRRFREVEAGAESTGKSLQQMTLPEMDALWDAAKEREGRRPECGQEG